MIECPQCGDQYTDLGKHWYQSNCRYPELTHYQKSILVGILMGDGCIDRSGRNPRVSVNMATLEYLEYVDDLFPLYGTGVYHKQTAEESARLNRESGFQPDARTENYSHIYQWRTRSSPTFNYLATWYNSGRKVFPEDIQLNGTTLSHWYVNDGWIDQTGKHFEMNISMPNERDSKNKIDNLFERQSLPSPSRWDERLRSKQPGKRCTATWNVSESRELFHHMGDPIPGFENKWPPED